MAEHHDPLDAVPSLRILARLAWLPRVFMGFAIVTTSPLSWDGRPFHLVLESEDVAHRPGWHIPHDLPEGRVFPILFPRSKEITADLSFMHCKTSLSISSVYYVWFCGAGGVERNSTWRCRVVVAQLGILTRRICTSLYGVLVFWGMAKSTSAVCMARIMILENRHPCCKCHS